MSFDNLQRLNMLHFRIDYEELDANDNINFIQERIQETEEMAREEINSRPWRNACNRVVITEVYSESLPLED